METAILTQQLISTLILGGAGGELLWILTKALLVVGLLGVGGWIFMRTIRSQKHFGNTQHIRILDRTSLGARRTLYLVEVEGQRWLLGASETGLVSLAEVRTNKETTQPVNRPESGPESGPVNVAVLTLDGSSQGLPETPQSNFAEHLERWPIMSPLKREKDKL